ncbi:hypothetical protein HDU93_000073 [Gonapodya sp. JEL0774]|nr:hypothetical protein HDU93_000073 [Gonapodya sp. JEL0774]
MSSQDGGADLSWKSKGISNKSSSAERRGVLYSANLYQDDLVAGVDDDREQKGDHSGKGGAWAAKRRMEREKANLHRSRIEVTLFQVLHSMVTGNETPRSLAFPLLFFEDMQMLYFCWHPGRSFPGMPSWAPYIWNPLILRPAAYNSFLILFGIAMLVVGTLIGTIVFCAVSFSSGKFKYIFPLNLLRAGTLLAVGILNIPIAEVLITVLHCKEGSIYLYPEVQCFSTAAHLIPFILAVMGLLLFVPYTLLMALSYVDGNPKSSKNTTTRANGRTDFLYIAIKLFIVFIWEFVELPIAKLGFLVPCLLILTKEVLHRQPFHNETLQTIRAGILTTASLSSIIAILAEAMDSDSIVPFVFLCLALLVGFIAGAIVNKLLFKRITQQVYDRFQSRVKLMRARDAGVVSFAALPKSSSTRGKFFEMPEDPTSVLEEISDNIGKLTSERVNEEPPMFNSPNDVELACRFVRYSKDPKSMLLMRELYEAAFQQFPKDGYVHIQAAMYLLAFGAETTMVIHPEETNAEKAEDIPYHLETLMELKAFWTYVRRATTSKDYLLYPNYLSAIATATMLCHDNYKRLLERFPKSKMVLRLYAQFHAVVLTDPDETRRLLGLADELEDTTNNSDAILQLDNVSAGEQESELVMVDRSPSAQTGVIPDQAQEMLDENIEIVDPATSHKRISLKPITDDLNERPPSVPQTYSKRLQIIMLMIGGMIIFALVYSNFVISSLDDSISEFLLTTDIGRYALAICQSARLMSYWGHQGDFKQFNHWRSEMMTYHDKLFLESMPYLTARSDMTTGIQQIIKYDEVSTPGGRVSPHLKYVNQYQLASEVLEASASLALEDISYYQSVAPSSDRRVRFLVDNMLVAGQGLRDVNINGEAEFVSNVTSQLTVIYVLLVLECLVVMALGFFVFYPLLTGTHRMQLGYLKYIRSISKKVTDEILLTIDEQLEFLQIDDGVKLPSNLGQDGPRTGEGWKTSMNFWASLFAIGVCSIAVLVPVLLRLPINEEYIKIVNYTGSGRKYFIREVRTLAYEVDRQS